MTAWAAVAARAWGLATHLLDDERVGRIQRAGSLAELVRELRDTVYARHLTGREVGPAQLEPCIARSLADRIATLARWAEPDRRALDALFLEMDAHSVRGLLRGAVAGVAPDRRVGGAVPTPTLDRRGLETLARADTPGRIAATLAAWGHPLGAPLLDEAGGRSPDLFRLETVLARAFAAGAREAARAGGRHVREHVAAGIDTHNASSALLLVGARVEGAVGDYYVEGGAIARADFERAAASVDRARCASLLADTTRGSALATALGDPSIGPAGLAVREMRERIRRLRRAARQEPISAVPVLLLTLRLRLEAHDLRRALWRVSLS